MGASAGKCTANLKNRCYAFAHALHTIWWLLASDHFSKAQANGSRSSLLLDRLVVGVSGAGDVDVDPYPKCTFGYATSEANINSAGLPAQVQFNQEDIMLAATLSPRSLGSVPPTAVLPQIMARSSPTMLPLTAPARAASSLERLAFDMSGVAL